MSSDSKTALPLASALTPAPELEAQVNGLSRALARMNEARATEIQKHHDTKQSLWMRQRNLAWNGNTASHEAKVELRKKIAEDESTLKHLVWSINDRKTGINTVSLKFDTAWFALTTSTVCANLIRLNIPQDLLNIFLDYLRADDNSRA